MNAILLKLQSITRYVTKDYVGQQIIDLDKSSLE
jgi:hypothetical protein